MSIFLETEIWRCWICSVVATLRNDILWHVESNMRRVLPSLVNSHNQQHKPKSPTVIEENTRAICPKANLELIYRKGE